MSDQTLETLSLEDLQRAHGGLSPSDISPEARWIMNKESGGNTHAQNPTSSAYGAFQMLKATRKQYMGADWQSSEFGAQYKGANGYVQDRYGSWGNAKQFWQSHHWY